MNSYLELTERDRELLLTGLSPEIGDPVIVNALPPIPDAIPGCLPVTDYCSGAVLTDWVCECPVGHTTQRVGVLLARALADPNYADDAPAFLAPMAPLDTCYLVAEGYPDFTPAIDLRALANGADGVSGIFAAALRVVGERLVRVCHGAVGEGVTVHLFVDGLAVPHGGYLRMAEGIHVLVMQTSSGAVRNSWQWPERRVGIRFDDVDERDVRALVEWQRGRWGETCDAMRSDESGLSAGIEIDPATVVGREGFIRVGRSRGGKWWLLDAEGKPFYYRAICSVNNRGGAGGRRKGDPPHSPAMVRHWLRRIQSLGFNGLGSWTTREFFDQGLYFTEIIESFYEGPYLQDGLYRYGVVPDVFDPEWERRIDRKCRSLCAPLAESKLLVGYFLDNERDFLVTRRPAGVTGPVYRVGAEVEQRRVVVEAEPIQNPEKLGLLQLALSLPTSRPASQEAWRFVLERHGHLAGLGAAWGIPVASRLAFNEMTVNGERLISDAYLEDERAFIHVFVRRYFEICVAAIRRYDPNHMIIGVRWAGLPDRAILEEEIRACDIISMNRYRAHIAEFFDQVYRYVGKPILIGECEPTNDSFLCVRDPIEPPGGYDDEMVRCDTRVHETMNRVFEHPGIVGYTYYAWKNGAGHPELLRPIQQANWRAARRRARREKTPLPGTFAPLHGQIFVVLTGVAHDQLCLGFICRQGVWEPTVYGDGIRGNVSDFSENGGTIRLELAYTLSRGMFIGTPGGGRCRIELQRVREDELTGTVSGTFDGISVDGFATAYVHRPIPNVEL